MKASPTMHQVVQQVVDPIVSKGAGMNTQAKRQAPLFSLGQVVATPGAVDALRQANQTPFEFLARHVVGDWGELDPQDVQANEEALQGGTRLLSRYQTIQGVVVWLITEHDRSVTTLLLPAEY